MLSHISPTEDVMIMNLYSSVTDITPLNHTQFVCVERSELRSAFEPYHAVSTIQLSSTSQMLCTRDQEKYVIDSRHITGNSVSYHCFILYFMYIQTRLLSFYFLVPYPMLSRHFSRARSHTLVKGTVLCFMWISSHSHKRPISCLSGLSSV